MTDDPNSEMLRRCPFCGSSNIDPTGVASMTPGEDKILYKPACSDCDATTGGDWNTRPDDGLHACFTGLDAALPHLRPDTGRDEYKADAERFRWLASQWPYAAIENVRAMTLDEVRSEIDADRARAEDKEAGA